MLKSWQFQEIFCCWLDIVSAFPRWIKGLEISENILVFGKIKINSSYTFGKKSLSKMHAFILLQNAWMI